MPGWIGSLKQKRFLEAYRAQPKDHVIYVLEVPDDGVCKLGRSSRLLYRCRNLRASMYKQHSLRIIRCVDAAESLALDRWLKKRFAQKHLIGEFYTIAADDVKRALEESSEFSHLCFTTDDDTTP
eukprot:55781-Eustigmatos_ZCMA.PRE.1